MSEIKWGLISKVDADCLMKTIDLIYEQFPNEVIYTCEIGLYSGLTSEAICKYIGLKKHRVFFHTGIDNGKDGEELKHFPPFNSKLIIGNSNEVYNQLEDESQHLIFIDGLHTFAGVISDFFCYAPKVKKEGYIAFHDTGVHLDKLSGWQGVGDKNDPDMCLGGVRKALVAMGLIPENTIDPHEYVLCYEDLLNWELIFDEADPNDLGGGITVFKRI